MDLVINLNKPKGITSQAATTKARKILNIKKAGHTGTLDPSATGVLLICTNRATRLASYLSSLDKEYRAVMKLGEVTDTQDADGNVIEKNDRVEVDEITIKNILKSFEGKILQVPPMFSAIKYKGKPLYKYAKKGLDIPRKPREVYIKYIKFLSIDIPFVSFIAACSKGTYIRTLCNDVGEKLGTGAHLFELERTAIGQFSIKEALSFEELLSAGPKVVEGKGCYTMDRALTWMPELIIKDSLIKDVRNGVPIKQSDCLNFVHALASANYAGIKIKSQNNEFLAIGSFLTGKKIIKMDVVFGT